MGHYSAEMDKQEEALGKFRWYFLFVLDLDEACLLLQLLLKATWHESRRWLVWSSNGPSGEMFGFNFGRLIWKEFFLTSLLSFRRKRKKKRKRKTYMTYLYYNSSRPAARSTSSDLKQFDTFVLLFLLFTFRKIQICCLMMLYNEIKANKKSI